MKPHFNKRAHITKGLHGNRWTVQLYLKTRGRRIKAFKNAAVRDGWMLEPRHFEMVHGITGIAGRYKYPDRQTAYAFAQSGRLPNAFVHYDFSDLANVRPRGDVPSAVLADAQKLWSELVTLNPVLKKVRMDEGNLLSLAHGCIGVASGFNHGDISYFIAAAKKDCRVYLNAYKDPVWMKALKKILPLLREDSRWVPSPKTLTKIYLQLERQASAVPCRGFKG